MNENTGLNVRLWGQSVQTSRQDAPRDNMRRRGRRVIYEYLITRNGLSLKGWGGCDFAVLGAHVMELLARLFHPAGVMTKYMKFCRGRREYAALEGCSQRSPNLSHRSVYPVSQAFPWITASSSLVYVLICLSNGRRLDFEASIR